MIHILPLTDAMLDDAVALEIECFPHPWSKHSLETELHRDSSHFFAAEWNEKIIGYAGMTTVLDEASVTNVAVTAAFRRMGVGRALIQALKQRCRALGMAFLTLEVRPSNQAAVTLYKSECFETVGRRKNFYRDPSEDALLMTCRFDTGKRSVPIPSEEDPLCHL